MKRHITPFTICLIAAGAASAVALGGPPILHSLRGNQSPNVQPVLFTQSIGHTPRVTAGAPSEIVQSTLAKAQSPQILSARLSTTPSLGDQQAGYALTINVRVPTDGPAALKPLWEAEVAEGAVAESLAYTHARPLARTEVVGELPSGQQFPLPSGLGNVAAGQDFAAPSDEAIRTAISRTVASAGAKLLSVDVIRPDQPAPAVVIEVANQHDADAMEPSLIRNLFFQKGGAPTFEGYYIEFDDPSGNPLIIDRSSFRTGITGRWSARDEKVKDPTHPNVAG